MNAANQMKRTRNCHIHDTPYHELNGSQGHGTRLEAALHLTTFKDMRAGCASARTAFSTALQKGRESYPFPDPLARQAGRESEPAANHLRIALPIEDRTIIPSSSARHIFLWEAGPRDSGREEE